MRLDWPVLAPLPALAGMVLPALLLLAGCAATPGPAAPATSASPVVAGAIEDSSPTATIVARRPIPAGVQAAAFATLSTAPAPPARAASEFIITRPGGDTLSVVQVSDDLRPGQRVRIEFGPHTRIVRAD